ncbi:transporter [Rufibacter sediminis]|uniref:Transporter n=1 Tax=Rufibacter sediminis TaxID=2762756 RepID=A0ABR6VZ90_9BACT|nr:transporter [Rufibacter sediminis]MBC3542265.1 transporter [Rufibacter sediminis]
MKQWLLYLLASLPLVCHAQAQRDSLSQTPINTDRPNQTEASSVVPFGTLQVESGWFRQVDRIDGVRTMDVFYPITLIRLGILERMELRFQDEFHKNELKDESGPHQTKGLDAFTIGTKINVTEEKGLLPEIAFLGNLVIPSGSSAFRPAHVAPEVRLALSHTLSNTFDLGYNVGYEWDGDSPEGTGIYTLSVGAALPHHWGTYLEVFGDKPEKGHWHHSADGGFTFSPRNNLQLDVSSGIGLTKDAPDYFLSAGFTFRLPK